MIDFFRQSQDAMNQGINMGQAIQQQRLRQQQEQRAQELQPLKIDALRQNMQAKQQQMESQQRDDMRKGLQQDAMMLGALDEEVGKEKLIPELVNKYTQMANAGDKTAQGVLDGLSSLQTKTGADYISSILQFNAALSGKSQNATPESRSFNDLIKDFTPEEKKIARRVKAGLKGRAVSNAVLSAIESGDVENLADAEATIKEAGKFAEMTGSSRARAIDKGFENIVKFDESIGNIDKAIEAVQDGAGTGAIEKNFPSIKAASVLLDNIQGQMALDVVGATTFGALSKGELDLAKAIALPTGLEGDELVVYLKQKKAAQEKLKNYYSEQIEFIDQGGTVAGFLRSKKKEQKKPEVITSQYQEGATATGPNGQKMRYTNGEWVRI